MAFNYEFPYTDPNLYNDDWILSQMKGILEALKDIEDETSQFWEAYREMKQLVEDIENGNFPESIQQAFITWMQENAIDLVGELVKLVWFGLSDQGYWVAYIPEGWDDIVFNTTGLDIFLAEYPEYGRLVFSMQVGGA